MSDKTAENRGPARNRLPVGVLVSGSGTNLQALIDAVDRGELPIEIKAVVCNVKTAGGLDRARKHGIPAIHVDHKAHGSREEFDRSVTAELVRAGVELVVLAGFMRLLSAEFTERWHGKLINIHPSLLPAFKGVAAQRQALEYGAKVSGCTVHFVDAGMDSGPIILQRAVPVLPSDTEHDLQQRILAEEHVALPEAVRLIAEGRISLQGRMVVVSDQP